MDTQNYSSNKMPPLERIPYIQAARNILRQKQRPTDWMKDGLFIHWRRNIPFGLIMDYTTISWGKVWPQSCLPTSGASRTRYWHFDSQLIWQNRRSPLCSSFIRQYIQFHLFKCFAEKTQSPQQESQIPIDQDNKSFMPFLTLNQRVSPFRVGGA